MAVADGQVHDREEPPAAPIAVVEAPVPRPHRWAFELNLGLGTPAGVVSLSRDLRIDDRFGARATVGVATLTLMPYLAQRLGRRGELRLSAGLTAGRSVWREQHGICFSDDCASKKSWQTVFSNLEISATHRLGKTFFVKPYLGISSALNPDSLDCVGGDDAIAHCQSDHADDGNQRVYGGVAIGTGW